jgi:ElaB/YqjD/DUF883 family membrane-anchored ribosome-binding protein
MVGRAAFAAPNRTGYLRMRARRLSTAMAGRHRLVLGQGADDPRGDPAPIMAGDGRDADSPPEATLMESPMSNSEMSREKLVDDFAAVLAEAEEMLKRAAAETGDKARDLRSQVETKLLRAKLRLQEIEGEAVDRAKAAARATDDYVHENPWRAIGVATAIGLVVGLMLNRRS